MLAAVLTSLILMLYKARVPRSGDLNSAEGNSTVYSIANLLYIRLIEDQLY